MREAEEIYNSFSEMLFSPFEMNKKQTLLMIKQAQTEAYNEAIRDAADRADKCAFVSKIKDAILSLLKK